MAMLDNLVEKFAVLVRWRAAAAIQGSSVVCGFQAFRVQAHESYCFQTPRFPTLATDWAPAGGYSHSKVSSLVKRWILWATALVWALERTKQVTRRSCGSANLSLVYGLLLEHLWRPEVQEIRCLTVAPGPFGSGFLLLSPISF